MRTPASALEGSDRGGAAFLAPRRAGGDALWMRLWSAHRACRFDEVGEIAVQLADAAGARFAAAAGGPRRIVADARSLRGPLEPGFALLQPPLIGVDARSLRDRADRRGVALLVITREPLTRSGEWPIVAASTNKTIRTRIKPPVPLERLDDSMTRDSGNIVPEEEWFRFASRAIGKAGIESVDPHAHPWWRVDDLVGLCDVHRDDSGLFECLTAACAEASVMAAPQHARPREFGHPHSF